MTSKDERLAFLEEMKDVRRIRKPNKAEVAVPRELTPGHLARQQAAVETPVRDLNPLTSDMVEPLTAHDVLSWMRPGIQHGVFRKYWSCARADSFDPPEFILKLRETKLR